MPPAFRKAWSAPQSRFVSYGKKDGMREVDHKWKDPGSLGVQEADGGCTAVVRELRKATADARANELVVVALGPLTNIAAAIKEDPSLPSKWKRLVVMGGSTDRSKNPQFNFAADPDAAKYVLAAYSGAPPSSTPPTSATTSVTTRQATTSVQNSQVTASVQDGRANPSEHKHQAIISVQRDSTCRCAPCLGCSCCSQQLLLVTRDFVLDKSNTVPLETFLQWSSQGGAISTFMRAIWEGEKGVAPAHSDEDQRQRMCLYDVVAMAVALYPDELGVEAAVQKATKVQLDLDGYLSWAPQLPTKTGPLNRARLLEALCRSTGCLQC